MQFARDVGSFRDLASQCEGGCVEQAVRGLRPPVVFGFMELAVNVGNTLYVHDILPIKFHQRVVSVPVSERGRLVSLELLTLCRGELVINPLRCYLHLVLSLTAQRANSFLPKTLRVLGL